MEINENQTDRIIRVILGIIFIIGAIYLIMANTDIVILSLGVILGIVGIIALVTGATGFCLLYKVLGFSTCPSK